MSEVTAMTGQTVEELLEAHGATVRLREGRSESYGAPRDFSFEVKGLFPNGMGLQVIARQFNYRDPWETEGRVNDLVDVFLLRDGAYTSLPKGFPFFQGTEVEEGRDLKSLEDIAACVAGMNVKLYLLQELTGDF